LDNNYRLQSFSTLIDAANNAGLDSVEVDLDGVERFVNDPQTADSGVPSTQHSCAVVDMGPYEFPVGQAEIVDWKSVVTHGASNTIGLVVGSDSTFSESRDDGIVKLRVSFSSPIDPATVSAGNVVICGNDVDSQGVDLSGITITTSVLSGDMGVDINFSPKLPNYARYRVRLDGVTDVACHTITTNNERILTALFGDITGDRRVNATDVGGARSLVPRYTIDPGITPEVRSDVDTDNDIDENFDPPSDTDVEFVRDQVPKDARYIANPSCP